MVFFCVKDTSAELLCATETAALMCQTTAGGHRKCFDHSAVNSHTSVSQSGLSTPAAFVLMSDACRCCASSAAAAIRKALNLKNRLCVVVTEIRFFFVLYVRMCFYSSHEVNKHGF